MLAQWSQWPRQQLPHCLTSQPWSILPCAITTHPITVQHSPDNDAHQPHNSLIEAVKEVPQDSALVFHATNDQPKGHREDHKAQGIDAISWARHRHSLLEGQHLLQSAQGPCDIFQEAGSILHWRWRRHGGALLRSILCPHHGPGYQPCAVLRLELEYGKIGTKFDSDRMHESPGEMSS